MHLVKWIRKNNRKIMVFVIIAIMAAFVLGQGVKFLFDSVFDVNKRVIATYDDGKKIRYSDARVAHNELRILRMLMADRLLMGQSGSGPLLVHLLFPDSQLSAQVASQMKQAIQRGQLSISADELDDFFQQQPEQPEILWLLLKDEAYRAGCVVANDNAAEVLLYAVPQMTNNQLSTAALVNQAIRQSNSSEDQILRVFADMMSILAYAESVMDSQAVTINQVKASLGRSKERIDAEFVKIEAEPLIDEDANITDAQIQEQFETYKAGVAGIPTEDNPFGFGYKLSKRVQLEYMIVLTDDVKKQLDKPAAEVIEEYYANNIARFQTQEPSDPNDPESEKIVKTRPFAEAEAEIRRTIETEKATTQANILFNDIKDKTESGFETLNFDEASVGQLQKAAEDFSAVGEELAKKYNIPIAVGKTGWLDAGAFGQDKILANLSVRRGQNFLRLNDLAFAATEEKSQQQRIGIPSVRVWENLGPFSGGYYSAEDSKFYRLTALVRVVGIEEAGAAGSVNTTFDTKGVVLDKKPAEEDTSFSLAEQVKDDIRLVAAMKTATARGQELAATIADSGWDDAIAAYNKKHAGDDPNENEDLRIELDTAKQKLRISQADLKRAKQFITENPGLSQGAGQWLAANMLTDKLYALLDEDAETTGTIQTVLAFEPEAACYIVKEVVRQPATTADYLDNKAQTALQLNTIKSAGLALIHFSPENILERMACQRIQQEDEEPEEAIAPTENEED